MIYYRVSDNSYPKAKLPGATKWFCWSNFLKALAGGPVQLVLDNCAPGTVGRFARQGHPCHETSLGNAGSLLYALRLAAGRPPDEVVYFVEDDYLHRPGFTAALGEGLGLADYVTLYDHPDKYSAEYAHGEVSKVLKTPSSHWRYTASTCMTFASTAGVIREDFGVWERHAGGSHPNDHGAFTELGGRGRKLAVSIPGKACHCDPTWGGMEAIEPWAVEMVLDHYSGLAEDDHTACAYRDKILADSCSRVDKLKMLHGVLVE